MTSWDPEHYEAFYRERLQPGLDLIHRLPGIDAHSIVDLGCGTGRLTHELASRFPAANTVGIDRSAEMLATAAPGLASFEIGDIETWKPAKPVDILYANASLQWIPDHHDLFPRLIGEIASSGLLAVQMPLSWDLPSHRAVRSVAADYNIEITEPPTLAPAEYLEVLSPLASEADVWTTTYLHVLPGHNPVFHWVSSTGIKRFLARIDESRHSEFLAQCADEIGRCYPARPDGLTVYPFMRLFILARK